MPVSIFLKEAALTSTQEMESGSIKRDYFARLLNESALV